MSKIDKSLSELFGVDPLYPEQTNTELQVVDREHKAIAVMNDPDSSDLDQDIALIRNNIHALIRSGQEAFESVIHIAKAEERISAFEVGNAFLANLASINMQLLSIHEKKKKIQSPVKGEEKPGQIVNNGGTTNIAFVGTTKELMESIKKQGMLDQVIDQDPIE